MSDSSGFERRAAATRAALLFGVLGLLAPFIALLAFPDAKTEDPILLVSMGSLVFLMTPTLMAGLQVANHRRLRSAVGTSELSWQISTQEWDATRRVLQRARFTGGLKNFGLVVVVFGFVAMTSEGMFDIPMMVPMFVGLPLGIGVGIYCTYLFSAFSQAGDAGMSFVARGQVLRIGDDGLYFAGTSMWTAAWNEAAGGLTLSVGGTRGENPTLLRVPCPYEERAAIKAWVEALPKRPGRAGNVQRAQAVLDRKGTSHEEFEQELRELVANTAVHTSDSVSARTTAVVILLSICAVCFYVAYDFSNDADRMDAEAAAVKTWPTSPGQVISKRVKTVKVSDISRVYCPFVKFSYEVGDESYESEDYSPTGADCLDTEELATQFMDTWPVGSTLDVIVNPKDPDEAYMTSIDDPDYRDGTRRLMWMWIVFGGAGLIGTAIAGFALGNQESGDRESIMRKNLAKAWRHDGREPPPM